jgi:hypothetical protein
MSTALDYLTAGTYFNRCSFSRLADFRSAVGHYFENLAFERETVEREIDELLEQFSNVDTIGQTEATMLLVAREMKAIKDRLSNVPIERPVERLQHDFAKLTEQLAHLGLGEEEVRLFIVDNFPRPFERMPWDAGFFEETERVSFGIEPGVYVKRSSILPFYSTYRVAHEMLHVVMGRLGANVKTGLARGLEEGLCDLVGSIFLGSEIFGWEICRNLVIYDRVGFWPDRQFLELYHETLRQALMIYKEYGLDGAVEIFRRGRVFCKDIERRVLTGDLDLNIASGRWSREVNEIANLVLSMPRSLVVSPLAWYMSEFLKPGMSITELLKDHNLKDEEARKALRELQERVFLIVVGWDRDTVQYDDTKLYLDTKTLRYEIAGRL